MMFVLSVENVVYVRVGLEFGSVLVRSDNIKEQFCAFGPIREDRSRFNRSLFAFLIKSLRHAGRTVKSILKKFADSNVIGREVGLTMNPRRDLRSILLPLGEGAAQRRLRGLSLS